MKKKAAGLFIVIEGTDGSGKGTQFALLHKRLQRAGYRVATFDFPQYDKPSSYFAKQYLNGAYGDAAAVGPYAGSLFYALDRYEAAGAIRQALAAGKVVLANRYTGSNLGHQGTKFSDATERRAYFSWLTNLEYDLLGIPRPTKSFVLRVPAEIAQSLVDQKATRSYTDKKRDLHEADLEHLQKAVAVYDGLCAQFPRDFERLDCVRHDALLGIEQIHELLWERVVTLLPPHTAEQVVATDNPYVTADDRGLRPSSAGQDYLARIVTDATGDVYAFTGGLSPVTIAAAMARLSRRGDDMRLTILDEFAHAMHQDEQLLQRVITAYGDDSIQQLVGIHLVVENASNLLTKKLEWGRLAAYLEQSTRYIYFDQKDAAGQYKYYVPASFDAATSADYRQAMDQLFDTYSVMVRQLTDYVRAQSDVPDAERDGAWKAATRAQACDAARTVLPTATKATVGIYASGQALESLIMHLLSDELPEARTTGQALLKEARKVLPSFLERADKPERGGATIAYRANTRQHMQTLADAQLPADYGTASGQAVTLSDVWPRNELAIVPDMLYEHTSMALADIRTAVADWPYAQKADVFTAYMGERLNRRHRPGRALEKIHYSWDIVCDYGIFRDLQRHRMVDDLAWQMLTPRYGYEVPDLIEKAGLTDLFEQCFDGSLHLYSLLQSRGYSREAQYATLLGHRMRWKVTYNARAAFHLHELRTSPQGHSSYRKLVQEMHRQVAAVHPLTAAAMQFVSQAEDPALTRLAAERYTQYKLSQLS